MEKFLSEPDNPDNAIHFKLRRMIREIDSFCPEAAGAMRALALHCFLTIPGNYCCTYHAHFDTRGKYHDAVGGKHGCHVTGTPHPRKMNRMQAKTTVQRPPQPRIKGYLHCGCPEDDVLLSFFWYKWGLMVSPLNGRQEGWRGQHLEPRMRTFMVAEWQWWTQSSVNDIYLGKLDPDRKSVV